MRIGYNLGIIGYVKNMHKAQKVFGFVVGAAMLVAPSLAFASTNITLFGANPDSAVLGGSYVDPGYSAFSTFDGDITSSVLVSGGSTGLLGISTRTYSVTDSNGDSDVQTRDINVSAPAAAPAGGGAGMPFCSSPFAPGWNVSLPGGGCGGQEIMIQSGHSAVIRGVEYKCPEWFGAVGCMVK